jgi:hypothetical protein
MSSKKTYEAKNKFSRREMPFMDVIFGERASFKLDSFLLLDFVEIHQIHSFQMDFVASLPRGFSGMPKALYVTRLFPLIM